MVGVLNLNDLALFIIEKYKLLKLDNYCRASKIIDALQQVEGIDQLD